MSRSDVRGYEYSLLNGMTYYQRSYGCQMNVNDAERVAGMLDHAGCIPVNTLEEADIAVFLTCCVREAADIRLMGQVASIKNITPRNPDTGRIIAVGGCIGQRDGAKLQEQLDHVDVVFGTHNLGHLVKLLEQRLDTGEPVVELIGENDGFSSDLPVRRVKPWHAWIPIMTGCDNFCSYCVVPYVRGHETSRPLEDIERELQALDTETIKEITLLGQNVNSYGRDLYGSPQFSKILTLAAQTEIERIRFVTSHPKDLLPATMDAMASFDNIMPQLHLPLQSGSDRILKAMNRVYDSSQYRATVALLREKVPDISLSTDIIVGFPGETAEDFECTMKMVAEMRYGQAFTFIYSKRDGTPAADMPGQIPRDVALERYERLQKLVQESAYTQNLKELQADIPVLIEGTSRRDEEMLAGKSPKNQTVHVPIPDGATSADYAGRIAPVHITETHTWYLKGNLTGNGRV